VDSSRFAYRDKIPINVVESEVSSSQCVIVNLMFTCVIVNFASAIVIQ
jgi:hypothetical protein